jgi:uncharacterized membrane protein YedE/YeeE
MVAGSELLNAFIGGILIAAATSFNLLFKGRITGISGVVFGIATPMREGFFWKVSFIIGLLFSTNFIYLMNSEYYETYEDFRNGLSLIGFLIAGFFVGFGTKLGNGCTSGHGVCGMSRISVRSIVASITFLSFGIGMANWNDYYPMFIKDIGDKEYIGEKFILTDELKRIFLIIFGLLSGLIIVIGLILKKDIYDFLISFIAGLLFGSGLSISGMVKRKKCINFLKFSSNWDASLLILLITAVSINLVLFYLILKKKEKPILAEKMELPKKSNIDWKLIVGAAVFGIGWGLSGLCPGALLANFINFTPYSLIFFATLILGQYAAVVLEKITTSKNN